MAANLQRFVAKNKDVVENVMDVFASIADFFPVCSIVTPLVRLALDNVESEQAVKMKEQFQKVQERLEVVSEQTQCINNEFNKSQMDIKYFPAQENIRNQFRKYMDIFNARPTYAANRKVEFLGHFDKTGGVKNLHTLYDAVTMEGSVLEITLKHCQNSRREMEEFCHELMALFSAGLIALMGYTILSVAHEPITKGDDNGEEILNNWKEKMKAVQVKMIAVIKDCIDSFPKQATEDCRQFVRDRSEMTNQQLADALKELLMKKFDWVKWSVRIFKTPTGLFANKKDFHHLIGNSSFQVPCSDEKLNIMVSYSASPKPIDKLCIQDLILNQKKSTVVGVAEMLFEKLPGSNMVHTVRTTNDLACSSNFTSDLHYWDEHKFKCKCQHKNFFVCAHSA